MARRDPCEKCDYRYIVRPAIAALHQQATISAACRACARRALAERDKLARDKARLETTNHDLRQKVYCAGHRCYECGHMVGMGNCTFRWGAARIAKRGKGAKQKPGKVDPNNTFGWREDWPS